MDKDTLSLINSHLITINNKLNNNYIQPDVQATLLQAKSTALLALATIDNKKVTLRGDIQPLHTETVRRIW